jgi:ABC-type branched-subunit amino acid transport system ATPase component/branched-subunit amino acid ABC-type transport system permease component
VSLVWQYALVGLAGGSAYALMALGVVAVYRGSGILNFAQGGMGMISAYVFWELSDSGNGSMPVGIAIVIGILVGIAQGVLFYLLVARLLRNASEVAKVVVTLGLMLGLESIALVAWGTDVHLILPLFGTGKVTIFHGIITDDTLLLLGVTAALAIGLWLMFTKTRLGLNATALRENPQAAAAIGITPHRTGLVTWALGGAMAAVAGILLSPVIGLSANALTLLVIPALAAALVGRFTGIASTVGLALLLGVVESVLGGKYNVNSGIVASLPFAVIIIAVVLGGRVLPGRGESLTIRLPKITSGRIPTSKALLVLAGGLAIALLLSSTWQTALINSCLFGLMALSIVVVTGFAGQISVASAAFAGFGAFIAALCTGAGISFIFCVILGTLSAVAMGLVFGAPAVRVRGINLAIVTLGLSLAVEDMILNEPGLTGGYSGLPIHDASLFGLDLSPSAHPQRFAILCVVVLGLGCVAAFNIRRGVSGRRYVSVRASERGAASLGMSVSGAKLGAFAVSAGLAGLAGALGVFQFSIADFSGYDVFSSISQIAFTALAGIGFVGGAIIAAISAPGGEIANFVSDILHWNSINEWLPVISGYFVIDVMIRYPDGAILTFGPLLRLLGRAHDALHLPSMPSLRRGAEEDAAAAAAFDLKTYRNSAMAGGGGGKTVLVAKDISVSYGAVKAVDGISFELKAGELLGVIGPNGAGKTSLIDALTGFNKLSSGTIVLSGKDLTHMRAHRMARNGMGRTFQNLELFDDLTVRENILAALDSRSRLPYATDLVKPGRGKLNPPALAAVSMLGLGPHLDQVVSDLPQGLRRMVAIARVVAQEPAAILMDEPAAGMNGAERRAASELFRALAHEFGAAVLLVEHNIDVVADSCDQLIALNFGRMIASGTTAEVLHDPAVREAYLGRISEAHTGQSEPAPAETRTPELA